ncbi:MAG: hypothetical protein IKH56_10060 [Oscillospiraceae bacterium]|nr:hypothetical protein [Oscillospiraceae bacterium]
MENRKAQEPYPMFGPGSELFPASPEMPDGVRSVTWPTPETGYMMNILHVKTQANVALLCMF